MLLTKLKTAFQLTKTFRRHTNGDLERTPYPNVWAVTSIDDQIKDIAEFTKNVSAHAALGHCLLKGNPNRPLIEESRAGSTDSTAATSWLCLDFDGIPDEFTADGKTFKVTPDLILDLMGLGNISYCLQWSASQGIVDTALRFHAFMLLTSPIPAPIVKQWLIQLNHEIPILRAAQNLTKTGNSLTWGLDITACQNDKLIYIAPPILKGIKNPLGARPRISLISKLKAAFTFPSSTRSAAENRKNTDARINELRELAGLPDRKFVYKRLKSADVLVKPEVCTITETRTERGFVYFNLNGGDSWAYYHPEDRPDVIYNFKGEPNYLTKELLPEYWESLTSQALRTNSQGLTYLVFLDRRTSVYYRGTYDQANDLLDITAAKNETQLRHFAEQYGVPLGSFIPEWDMTFDPKDSVRVDFENRSINTFQLTEYMKRTPKKVPKCPPTIFRIIHHVLGSDADCTVHFVNWLAYILQNRTRTQTAWVLHGTEGTGKGILMNRVLRPIFGRNQTTIRRMEELNEQYNAWMRQCFLVFIDEIEAKAFTNERGVMAKIRNFITEPFVTIRQMYASAVECENFTSWIFASNKPEPVIIPKDDRRHNVGKYQPKKLGMTDAELDRIPNELQAFHDYLLGYPVDKTAATTVLDNEDRSTMISISESSVDTVTSALLDHGSMEFLLDQLPATSTYSGDAATSQRIANYKHAMQTLMARTDLATGRCNISRDELFIIYDYVVGKMPESPNKFTSLLKHHRVITVKVRCDGKAVYGLAVTFKDVARFKEYAATHFPPPAPLPKKVTVPSVEAKRQ